jgi:predicted AAA+ superfamily ATPase
LAGRARYLRLLPFTRRERLGRIDEPPWLGRFLAPDGTEPLAEPPRGDAALPIADEEILDGGMPPIVVDGARRDLWFLGYEQTYLERDVRELSQVADLPAFRLLLQLAALRTGSLLNASNLARDAKLPVTTVTRYLGILETSFVLTRLTPYLRSRRRRHHKG